LKNEMRGKANYNHEKYITDVKRIILDDGFPDQTITNISQNILIKNTVFDFVLESSKITYLVLIRAYDDHYQSKTTSLELSKTFQNVTYDDFTIEISNKKAKIELLVIAPSYVKFLGKQSHSVPILKYIIKDKTFKNWNDIYDLLLKN